jgi:hypothetical protein
MFLAQKEQDIQRQAEMTANQDKEKNEGAIAQNKKKMGEYIVENNKLFNKGK